MTEEHESVSSDPSEGNGHCPDMQKLAMHREDALKASGLSVSGDDMRRYLEARVAGEQVLRPLARKLRS